MEKDKLEAVKRWLTGWIWKKAPGATAQCRGCDATLEKGDPAYRYIYGFHLQSGAREGCLCPDCAYEALLAMQKEINSLLLDATLHASHLSELEGETGTPDSDDGEDEWLVGMREVWISTVSIPTSHADTPAEAADKARKGEGEEVAFEYSHTLGKKNWTVEGPDNQYYDQLNIKGGK